MQRNCLTALVFVFACLALAPAASSPQLVQHLQFGGVFVGRAGEQPQPVVGSRSDVNDDVRASLMAFFVATGGTFGAWRNSTGWGSSRTVCSWFGVECEQVNRRDVVVKLSLMDNGLNGILPTPLLPALNSTLRELLLSVNDLRGAFPNIKHLTALRELELATNKFSGGLPELPASVQLSILNVNGCGLSGTLPSFQRQQQLQEILLSANNFTGQLPDFASLTKLTLLAINLNQFSGPVLESRLPSSLRTLSGQSNRFEGVLPAFVRQRGLQRLDLSNNQLHGSIPDFNLPQLERLQLQNNNLSAGIPPFSKLINLRRLDLSANPLGGTIPSFEHLQFLESALLANCSLSGTATLNNPSLTTLDLSGNVFLKGLDFLAHLPNLTSLDISHTRVHSLPSALPAGLVHFNALDCSLQGSIPPSWSDYKSLRTVILRRNNLTLPLPSLLHVNLLDLSGNQLRGDFTKAFDKMWHFTGVNDEVLAPSNIRVLDLSGNKLEGALSPYLFLPGFVTSRLFLDIDTLNVAGNRGMYGKLPLYSWVLFDNGTQLIASPNAQLLDFSDTNIDQDIPSAFTRFRYLQALFLQNTAMSGDVPNWIEIDASTPGFGSNENFTCPSFVSRLSGARIVLSPSYYRSKGCGCATNLFGLNGRCSLCTGTAGCKCGGTTLSGCMPQGGDDFLPCQRSIQGTTACNPDSDVPWLLNDSRATLDTPPAGWCKQGHEGRMCSRCSESYYQRGLQCPKCPPVATGWLVGLAYGICFLALVVFLVWRSKQANPRNQGTALVQIMLFHLQQLNELIKTHAVFTGWSAGVINTSSSAASFSLQSLLAIECAFPGYAVVHRVWVALVVMVLLTLLAAVTTRFNHRYARYAAAVWLGLLNFGYLPAVATGLLALGCSDVRSAGTRYLNLAPFQPCDAYWHAKILPPALALVCLLGVLAPAAVAFAMYRHRELLAASSFDEAPVLAAAFPQLSGFKPSMRWWFAVVLLRRLLLASLIAFVPYDWALLPLLVVLLLQISALLQHFGHPYGQASSNAAELASTYLLLLSYFAGLLLSSGLFSSSNVDAWMGLLAVANAGLLCYALTILVQRLARRRAAQVPIRSDAEELLPPDSELHSGESPRPNASKEPLLKSASALN